MNFKVPASIFVLALLAWFVYQATAPVSESEVIQDSGSIPNNTSAEPAPVVEAPSDIAPNFDRRQAQQVQQQQAQVEVDDLADVDTSPEAMERHETQLKALIDQYNDSLDDPEAKKAFEKQFKALSEDYKKAILAKLKKDEL